MEYSSSNAGELDRLCLDEKHRITSLTPRNRWSGCNSVSLCWADAGVTAKSADKRRFSYRPRPETLRSQKGPPAVSST